MENENISNSDKLKNSLCYIPFGWIVLFFTEENKSKILSKNIKYWTFLLFAFMLLQFIIVTILSIPLWWILFIIYAWISGFFGFKAYNWEDINIEYIDDFEKKVKNNLNDNKVKDKDKEEIIKTENTDDVKKDDKTENKDDDILNF